MSDLKSVSAVRPRVKKRKKYESVILRVIINGEKRKIGNGGS